MVIVIVRSGTYSSISGICALRIFTSYLLNLPPEPGTWGERVRGK